MAQHTVNTIWKGKTQFESDNPSGNKILIDSLEEKEASSSGLTPKAMMLSSLAGCSGLDIVSLLNKMRVQVDEFKIQIRAELTEEHPKHYCSVWVDYHFTGTDLNRDKIQKAVNLSVDKYCGVMEMFRKFASITTAVHYH
ncbi:MAG: OsmC family protein [Tenacibaculum sp.]